jgi:hypothetical protein
VNPSSARAQAGIAAGLAVVLGGAWLAFGTPVRIRWIVARGAPPASGRSADEAAGELRAMAAESRPILVGMLEDGATAWHRKAWVASVLLRAPFFEQAAVEKGLASSHAPTARAAAFALMDGEELLDRDRRRTFNDAVAAAQDPVDVKARTAPLEAWNPTPAIPVLAAWLGDKADRDARYAARLLGKIPPGDLRVRDALLSVVEEVPRIFTKDAPAELGWRKLLVVDCLQSLLAWAKDDPETASRVAKVVAWIGESGNTETGWDIQAYGLRLFEVARGRGVDPALLRTLATSPNTIVRMRVAHTMETVTGAESGEILKELVRDEAPTVRRAAILALRKRKDTLLLDLAPYLVEDAHVYCRSDALLSIGELRGVAIERCRAVLPLVVSCLEEPWPGGGVDPASPLAPYFAAARAEIVEGASLTLYRVLMPRVCPGFMVKGEPGKEAENLIFDNRRRTEIARALAADSEKRKKVVEEWRVLVPGPWPESNRVAPLVQRLEDRDPECALRACRELKRLTGEDRGIPAEFHGPSQDDTVHRNRIRELRKDGSWAKIVAQWKAR